VNGASQGIKVRAVPAAQLMLSPLIACSAGPI